MQIITYKVFYLSILDMCITDFTKWCTANRYFVSHWWQAKINQYIFISICMFSILITCPNQFNNHFIFSSSISSKFTFGVMSSFIILSLLVFLVTFVNCIISVPVMALYCFFLLIWNCFHITIIIKTQTLFIYI